MGYHSGSGLLEIAAPMPSSTCLPPLPYLCTGSIFSPKFLQPYSTSGTGLSLWVNKACVTSVSQSSAVCFSVRVSARTQQWVIKGKKTKRSEWTFVRYLWSGPLQAGRIFHICSAHYLQCFFFVKCLCVCSMCAFVTFRSCLFCQHMSMDVRDCLCVCVP